jgi:ribosomal protein S12 methylthiotransferase accessory factor
MDAVVIRGVEHRGEKQYWRGTQRSVAPEQTVETVRPVLPLAGITRVADITGLDRIGIPTTLVIRPNGLTLSNSTGKGFTLSAAAASGIMEAIELFHAEYPQLDSFRLPYAELAARQACLAVDELPLARCAPFNVDWPYRWILGWDLVGGREVALPLSIVHMGNRTTRIEDLFSFQITSNGLASGNTLLEAVNAALFEAIERDAITCWKVWRDATGDQPPVVDLDTIEHPLVRELLDRLSAAHMATILFDCTIDTDVPVYQAVIVDLEWKNVGVFKGYGAHLDPEIAMVRAITEAAQGRVVYIAGSRDDLFRNRDIHLRSDRNDRAAKMMLELLEPTVDARERRSDATDTFEGDTLCAVAKLERIGISSVLVVDLSRSDFPINVVKVVVPRLEGYTFENYQPGPRARAFRGRSATA